MNADRFLDTNILLYALSTIPEEGQKKWVALNLLESRDEALSVQVLQEFYVQAVRESRPDAIPHDQAVKLIESFLRFPVQVIDVGVLRAALATRKKYGIDENRHLEYQWSASPDRLRIALAASQATGYRLPAGTEARG